MPFAPTWMDLEIIILSEVRQTEKDKYHMISLICGILKKNYTNNRNRHTNRHRGKGWERDKLGVWD